MTRKSRKLGSVSGRPVEILIVEDNPDEAALTIDTIRQGQYGSNVTLVEDGVEAIAYLRQQGEFADAVQPDLILLDLIMPRKSGHEVLAEVKSDPALNRIPVIVMTNSSSSRDVDESYSLNANCHVQKPQNLDGYIQAVRRIVDFWNSFVKLSSAV